MDGRWKLFSFYVWMRCFCRRQITEKDSNRVKKTRCCRMKLHQVNQGRGEQRLPEPVSTTSATVAGVVDGTLEQALHGKA